MFPNCPAFRVGTFVDLLSRTRVELKRRFVGKKSCIDQVDWLSRTRVELKLHILVVPESVEH
jgi:hypothetical protein